MGSNNNISALVGNGSGYEYFVTSWAPITDTWYHIAITHDFSTKNNILYVNGNVEDEGIEPLSYSATPNTRIGRFYLASLPFNGLIDEVKIFDYALTQRQIMQEYNDGKPVGYWKFDEGEGVTAYDSSGNGNNGTITGNGTWSSSDSCVQNQCFQTNGTGDYAIVSDSSILEPKNITISTWLYFDTIIDTWLVSKQQSSGAEYNYGYLMRADSPSDTVFCRFGYGTGAYNSGSVSIVPNEWTHVVCTYEDAKGGSIYKNGELINEYSATESLDYTSVNDLGILGHYTGSFSSLDGRVDEVKIYNYALTPAEVKQEYNGGFSTYFK